MRVNLYSLRVILNTKIVIMTLVLQGLAFQCQSVSLVRSIRAAGIFKSDITKLYSRV